MGLGEPQFLCLLPDLVLGEAAQRQQDMGELALGEAVEHVGLVLLCVQTGL